VLGEGVDAPPRRNHDAVEEFLRPSRPLQPQLPNQEKNSQEDAVGDEGTAHDEVCQTLAKVVVLTETQCRNSTKEHLDPRDKGESLAVDAVYYADDGPDAAVEAFLEMELKIYSEGNLAKHLEEEYVRELGVDVIRDELAAFVHVPEEVAHDGEGGSQDL
jgi:hypothetical protein